MTFVIPHLTLLFTKCEGKVAAIPLSIASIGLTGMFTLELIAMRVEGVKNYFSQAWNYFDLAIVPVYAVFFFLRVQANYEEDTASELI